MRKEFIVLILCMGAVTYLPRLLPALLLDKMQFGAKSEKFLKMIPYTAMASLVFPGIFLVDPGRWYIGVAGGLVAAFLSWKKLPVSAAVAGAVAFLMATYMLLP